MDVAGQVKPEAAWSFFRKMPFQGLLPRPELRARHSVTSFFRRRRADVTAG
jgi:hypothetical protein